MGKLGKAKEIVIGLLILLVIIIGGSFYSEIMSGFWYNLIDIISYAFKKLWPYILILGVIFITIKYFNFKKKSE